MNYIYIGDLLIIKKTTRISDQSLFLAWREVPALLGFIQANFMLEFPHQEGSANTARLPLIHHLGNYRGGLYGSLSGRTFSHQNG
jgi:hypothetical protein